MKKWELGTKDRIMGADLRVLPTEQLTPLVASLRTRGFIVDVSEHLVELSEQRCNEMRIPFPQKPRQKTLIRCSRNGHTILLTIIADNEEFEGYRIYIPNLTSWWPARRRALTQFQDEVTAVLEEHGAYWPFDRSN